MRYTGIKEHLKPYSIASRKSTIAYAFASAIAPHDEFDDEKVREAIVWLGQDPDSDLRCAYCDSGAKSWDHVNGIVKSKPDTYLKEHDYFGENCLLKNLHYPPENVADIISLTNSKILVISRKDFSRIVNFTKKEYVKLPSVESEKLKWENFLKKKEREKQRQENF